MNRKIIAATIIFSCRKCGHQLLVTADRLPRTIAMLARVASTYPCPSCGEDPDGNWILDRVRVEEVESC